MSNDEGAGNATSELGSVVQDEAEAQAETPTGELGSGASHSRIYILYALMVLAVGGLLRFMLQAGNGIDAPKPEGGVEAAGGGGERAIDTQEIIWKLLLASVVIIVAARLLGAVCRRINQPQVVGEIVAGIVLGPSLLGVIWPDATSFLFNGDVLPFIDILAQIGLIFFMFLIGVELDMRLIRGRGHAAVVVSHASIIVPFLLGIALALGIFSELGSAEGEFVPFALFLGASMSITAFPVLARILTERGLYKTRLGAVTITCAAVDDVTAWCMLAVVVAVAAANGVGGAVVTIALSIAFIAFMILVVRPVLARLAAYHEEQGGLSGTVLAVLIAGVLLSALATDRIGIHAIFGAFLFGAIMPQRAEFITELVGKFEDFAVLFLLPLFFAYSGLRTDIGTIGADPQMWLFTGLITLVAIAGKWGGSSLAAKFVGLEWREAMGLGVLMNCRGLTELVILNIGLDLGVIPPALFAMLVIMALVTTFMTTPLLNFFYSRKVQEQMIAEAEGAEAATGEGEDQEERPWRILLPIADTSRAYELAHTALCLARDHTTPVQVILLHAVVSKGSGYGAGLRVSETQVERATRSLRPVVQFIEGAGYDAVPLVVPTQSLSRTITRVAAERDVDFVLLNYRKSLFGKQLLGGSMGEVIREAGSDVAVLVDPTQQGVAIGKGDRVLVPFGGGFHEEAALELALRLAKSSGATVSLVTDGDEERAHQVGTRAAESYEGAGVWTTPVVVDGDDVLSGLIQHAREADLVVLGFSDEWAEDQESLGALREAITSLTTTPMLIVRRHGQRSAKGPARWFRRNRGDWINDTGEIDIRDGNGEREVVAAGAGRDPSS